MYNTDVKFDGIRDNTQSDNVSSVASDFSAKVFSLKSQGHSFGGYGLNNVSFYNIFDDDKNEVTYDYNNKPETQEYTQEDQWANSFDNEEDIGNDDKPEVMKKHTCLDDEGKFIIGCKKESVQSEKVEDKGSNENCFNASGKFIAGCEGKGKIIEKSEDNEDSAWLDKNKKENDTLYDRKMYVLKENNATKSKSFGWNYDHNNVLQDKSTNNSVNGNSSIKSKSFGWNYNHNTHANGSAGGNTATKSKALRWNDNQNNVFQTKKTNSPVDGNMYLAISSSRYFSMGMPIEDEDYVINSSFVNYMNYPRLSSEVINNVVDEIGRLNFVLSENDYMLFSPIGMHVDTGVVGEFNNTEVHGTLVRVPNRDGNNSMYYKIDSIPVSPINYRLFDAVRYKNSSFSRELPIGPGGEMATVYILPFDAHISGTHYWREPVTPVLEDNISNIDNGSTLGNGVTELFRAMDRGSFTANKLGKYSLGFEMHSQDPLVSDGSGGYTYNNDYLQSSVFITPLNSSDVSADDSAIFAMSNGEFRDIALGENLNALEDQNLQNGSPSTVHSAVPQGMEGIGGDIEIVVNNIVNVRIRDLYHSNEVSLINTIMSSIDEIVESVSSTALTHIVASSGQRNIDNDVLDNTRTVSVDIVGRIIQDASIQTAVNSLGVISPVFDNAINESFELATSRVFESINHQSAMNLLIEVRDEVDWNSGYDNIVNVIRDQVMPQSGATNLPRQNAVVAVSGIDSMDISVLIFESARSTANSLLNVGDISNLDSLVRSVDRAFSEVITSASDAAIAYLIADSNGMAISSLEVRDIGLSVKNAVETSIWDSVVNITNVLGSHITYEVHDVMQRNVANLRGRIDDIVNYSNVMEIRDAVYDNIDWTSSRGDIAAVVSDHLNNINNDVNINSNVDVIINTVPEDIDNVPVFDANVERVNRIRDLITRPLEDTVRNALHPFVSGLSDVRIATPITEALRSAVDSVAIDLSDAVMYQAVVYFIDNEYVSEDDVQYMIDNATRITSTTMRDRVIDFIYESTGGFSNIAEQSIDLSIGEINRKISMIIDTSSMGDVMEDDNVLSVWRDFVQTDEFNALGITIPDAFMNVSEPEDYYHEDEVVEEQVDGRDIFELMRNSWSYQSAGYSILPRFIRYDRYNNLSSDTITNVVTEIESLTRSIAMQGHVPFPSIGFSDDTGIANRIGSDNFFGTLLRVPTNGDYNSIYYRVNRAAISPKNHRLFDFVTYSDTAIPFDIPSGPNGEMSSVYLLPFDAHINTRYSFSDSVTPVIEEDISDVADMSVLGGGISDLFRNMNKGNLGPNKFGKYTLGFEIHANNPLEFVNGVARPIYNGNGLLDTLFVTPLRSSDEDNDSYGLFSTNADVVRGYIENIDNLGDVNQMHQPEGMPSYQGQRGMMLRDNSSNGTEISGNMLVQDVMEGATSKLAYQFTDIQKSIRNLTNDIQNLGGGAVINFSGGSAGVPVNIINNLQYGTSVDISNYNIGANRVHNLFKNINGFREILEVPVDNNWYTVKALPMMLRKYNDKPFYGTLLKTKSGIDNVVSTKSDSKLGDKLLNIFGSGNSSSKANNTFNPVYYNIFYSDGPASANSMFTSVNYDASYVRDSMVNGMGVDKEVYLVPFIAFYRNPTNNNVFDYRLRDADNVKVPSYMKKVSYFDPSYSGSAGSGSGAMNKNITEGLVSSIQQLVNDIRGEQQAFSNFGEYVLGLEIHGKPPLRKDWWNDSDSVDNAKSMFYSDDVMGTIMFTPLLGEAEQGLLLNSQISTYAVPSGEPSDAILGYISPISDIVISG